MNIYQRQLHLFVLVASTLNISRASAVLGVSQPALSRAIKDFEDELGVALFRRTTRSVVLTPEGQQFLPMAKRFLGDLHHAVESLKNEKNELGGAVSVALGSAFAASVLSVVLRDFLHKHPGVHVDLNEDSSTGIAARVQRGEVDFGIGTRVGDVQSMVYERLLTAPIGIVFNPEYFRLPQRPSTARLKKLPLIRDVDDASVMNLLRLDGSEAISGIQVGNHVSSLALQLALTKAGVGVAVVSALAASHPMADDLQFVPLLPAASRELFLICRKDRPLRPPARALVDAMVNALPALPLHRLVRVGAGR
jgi:LysR family transcriptional regulator, carnitine catabolism transcriptional activator